MGFSKIIQLILIVLIMGQDASSLSMHTNDVTILQKDNSIILNCTYQIDGEEYISNRKIKWQKQINGEPKDIAMFSPPGGQLPFIEKEMQPLYKHRTELIAPNTSLSAVLIIKDPVCSDEGLYHCWIEYYPSIVGSETTQTVTSIVEFESKAIEPEEFVVFPNKLQENQSLSLTCHADVGSPRGYVQMWKTTKHSNTPQLIYTSNLTNNKTVNCTEFINVTFTYTVTRYDNGAHFQCSSQNNLTQGRGPTKNCSKISVFYGPYNTTLGASFSNSPPFIGDKVSMECTSEGNPNPNYTWKLNFSEIVSDAKYTFSANKSRLCFTITNTSDSGYYQCVASSNYIDGQWFNSSSNVTITVQEKNKVTDQSYIEQPCSENPCLLIENCIMKNGSENCSINIWSVIAFLFIALTFILCTMTISLILSRKKQQRKDNYNKGLNIGDVHVSYTREKFEDFGGYADPKDVKRPENGQIKSDKDLRDNPYADPVDFQTQYAIVHKNWETPAKSSKDANSSDSSNLINNTDSLNTGNLSSSETTNPKNSTNDEKTPGSTETSETIPKPPNVYDGAWV